MTIHRSVQAGMQVEKTGWRREGARFQKIPMAVGALAMQGRDHVVVTLASPTASKPTVAHDPTWRAGSTEVRRRKSIDTAPDHPITSAISGAPRTRAPLVCSRSAGSHRPTPADQQRSMTFKWGPRGLHAAENVPLRSPPVSTRYRFNGAGGPSCCPLISFPDSVHFAQQRNTSRAAKTIAIQFERCY